MKEEQKKPSTGTVIGTVISFAIGVGVLIYALSVLMKFI